MHSPDFLFPRFLVFPPANPSNFSHCKCFSIRISLSFTATVEPRLSEPSIIRMKDSVNNHFTGRYSHMHIKVHTWLESYSVLITEVAT